MGTTGNDVICGLGGNDSINGRDGSDIIDGGAGNDSMLGGTGSDTFIGGFGTDTVSYADHSCPVTIALTVSVNTTTNGCTAENDILVAGPNTTENVIGSTAGDVIIGNAAVNVLDGGNGNDNLDGGAGNDSLNGHDGNDLIKGNTGNDLILGGVGSDTFIGGTGLDTASYADHTCPVAVTLSEMATTTTNGCSTEGDRIATDVDNLTGGTGNDTLTGDSGANVLDGGSGNDNLDGGAGNDTINGRDGNDLIKGNTGNDLILGGAGPDTFIGGSGQDTVSYADHTCPVAATLSDTATTTTNGCNAEGDRIATDVDNLTGGTGNDTLTGDSGANVLSGGAGTDALISTTAGSTTTDTVNGGAGNDGFAAKTNDIVASGGGGSICPTGTELSIECSQGAFVTNVTQQSTVSTLDVATITIRAQVVDLGGVGLTKVALATTRSTTATMLDREYFQALPNQSISRPRWTGSGIVGGWTSTLVLESGTAVNGTWRATFSIPLPPPGLGIRLFTSGFRGIQATLSDTGSSPINSATPLPAQTFSCISTFTSASGDAECGISGIVATTVGMPQQVPPVLLDERREYRAPSLDALTVTSSTVTGTPTISVRIRTTAHTGTAIGQLAFGFRPPESSGRFAQPHVFFPTMRNYSPSPVLDRTYTLSYPFDVPGDWTIGIFLGDTSGSWPSMGSTGPFNWIDYEAANIKALGLNPTISVAPGPTPLAVTNTGFGSGTVTSSPAGIDCGTTCSTTVPWGTTVTLTATPAAGSIFAGWSGGCTGSAPSCTVSLKKATMVTATFSLPPTLTVTKSGFGSGTVSGPAGMACETTCTTTFPSGTQVTLSATADPGSSFGGWSVPECGLESTCTFTLTSDTTVRAAFLAPLSGVTALAAGARHTCVLASNGSVGCWGANNAGQLGDGTTTDSTTPVAVHGLTDAAAIAVGGDGGTGAHSCAVRAAGSVACWGSNGYGQLGNSDAGFSSTAVAVQGLSDVIAVTAGRVHTCALRSTGTVACWGWQGEGRLGNDVSSYSNSTTPVAVHGLTDAISIANGGDHSCALRRSGTVVCWGWNGSGQLGDGTTTERTTPVTVQNLTNATSIAATEGQSCARRSDSSVVCWGSNGSGQLGDGTTTDSTTPVTVQDLTDAIEVTAGAQHTCARRSDSSVVCWGNNDYGQLGDGTTTNRTTPVTIGS